ncbi:hypothetical protein [Actinoplanes sp. NPDC051851]|uniref:hypothetical protein n=1 Tax=Actinoplanes sp. NPDC051851 TaxID=3154753 RepID=UPI003423AAEC
MSDLERDEYGRLPHQLQATITDPIGLRVQVTVTVPAGWTWADSALSDCSEIAQITANRAMTQIQQCRKKAAEECPF